GGGRLGQCLADFVLKVALDKGDGDEHGEADAEREDDARHRRTWTVEIGEGKAQAGPAHALDAPRRRRDEQCRDAEGEERCRRAEDEPEGDAPIGRGDDGETGERRRRERDPDYAAGRWPRGGGRHHVAEEA